jgi:PKD repeat protein
LRIGVLTFGEGEKHMNTKLKRFLGLLSSMLFVLSIFSILTSAGIAPVYAQGTSIYLDPTNYIFDGATAPVGTLFNVTVRVANMDDMKTWQMKIFFNDAMINVTRWYEPKNDPSYVFYGKTTLPVPAPPDVKYEHQDPDVGSAGVGVSLFPSPSSGGGFTGDGILCIFTFEILSLPLSGQVFSCDLTIDNPAYTFWIKAGESDKRAYDVYTNGYYEITGPPGPVPPTADFTWAPTIPEVDRTVTFDASASTPNGGSIVSYEWDFDNDTVIDATGVVVTHAFSAEGVYNVTLIVEDSEGFSDMISKLVTVVPKPPYKSTDVNGDGFVDMADISLAIDAFLSEPGHPLWDERCDINNDELVDIVDIYIIIRDFRLASL